MIRVLPCLALALLVSLPGGPAAAQRVAPGSTGSTGQTKEDLAKVRDRIRALEKQTRQDQARRGQLDKQLREAETAASRIRQELNATRRELAEAQRRLEALNVQAEATRSSLDRQRAALAGQLRLAHMTGGSERVRAFFNQEDPAEIGRRLTWLAYLARSRGELLGSIQASLEALERELEAVTEQEAALAALEARRRDQLAELEGSRQQRAAVVARLDAQVKGQNRQLARARTQAASLERVLRELERAATRARQQSRAPDKPPPAPAPGKTLGKGRWPVAGQLLADFGQSRAGGQMRWDGVLIAAPAGTEVRATRAGKVVYADWLPGLGQLLVVDHGGGWLSLYGHNQDLSRGVGDRVAAGDVLGHVGDTGGQPRPALYYEVRRNGRPINPRQLGN
ncbi:MAG: peptidoglycan DD-metalloendopeptidase family protein [Gammaproteobacteria bacterium]|nr:peptidoglycan DD-metalloendopeptidase family protein [Gammaproteobacteria bacterium]